MEFLIIIPAYNEEEALPRVVEAALQCPEADVLIINDGSTDDTRRKAEKLAEENKRVEALSMPINRGIGASMQCGFIYAARHGYQMAAQFDGDGQHSVESLQKMLQKTREEKLDLCIGSRFLDLSPDNFQSTWLRRFGIIFLARLISLLIGFKVTDPTSGLRIYGKRAIEVFAACYPDDYPEPEALLIAARNRLRVAETEARMYERLDGSSSIRHLKTAYYMSKVTMSILVERLRGDKL